MASSDKKRKSKQVYKPGKGGARAARSRQASVRVKMKIARWKRYQEEIAAGTRQPAKAKSRTNYDTTGLERHLSKLEGIVKMGKTS